MSSRLWQGIHLSMWVQRRCSQRLWSGLAPSARALRWAQEWGAYGLYVLWAVSLVADDGQRFGRDVTGKLCVGLIVLGTMRPAALAETWWNGMRVVPLKPQSYVAGMFALEGVVLGTRIILPAAVILAASMWVRSGWQLSSQTFAGTLVIGLAALLVIVPLRVVWRQGDGRARLVGWLAGSLVFGALSVEGASWLGWFVRRTGEGVPSWASGEALLGDYLPGVLVAHVFMGPGGMSGRDVLLGVSMLIAIGVQYLMVSEGLTTALWASPDAGRVGSGRLKVTAWMARSIGGLFGSGQRGALVSREWTCFLREPTRWMPYAILPGGMALSLFLSPKWDVASVAVVMGAMALWCGDHLNVFMHERKGVVWLCMMPLNERDVLLAKGTLGVMATVTCVLLAVGMQCQSVHATLPRLVALQFVAAIGIWAIAAGLGVSVKSPYGHAEWRGGAPSADGLTAIMGVIGLACVGTLATLVWIAVAGRLWVWTAQFVPLAFGIGGLGYLAWSATGTARDLRSRWELVLLRVRDGGDRVLG